MRDIRRWAVYFAPKANTALARFGADWLGWDAQAGCARAGFDLPGLPRPRVQITATPRKYGFHATLKAPFRLGADREPAALDAAITRLAADFAPFDLPLRVSTLATFLALVPRDPCPPLDALAAACVTRLDAFRGAPEAAEHTRRHPEGLSARQLDHLEHWGYPFVLEDFHFHVTLTGSLDLPEREAVAAALDPTLAPMLVAPQPFGDICLFGEDGQGMFHLLKRFPLSGRAGNLD